MESRINKIRINLFKSKFDLFFFFTKIISVNENKLLRGKLEYMHKPLVQNETN